MGFVVSAAFVRIAQKGDDAIGRSKQHVFHCMALFLAAIICALFIVVVGARDRALSAIVKKGHNPSAGGLLAASSAKRCCKARR